MAGFASKSPGAYLQLVADSHEQALATGVPAFLGAVASPPGPGAFRLDGRTFAGLDGQGGGWAPGKLGLAVRGFFENGGQECLVVPLADMTGLSAALEVLSGMEGFDLVAAPDLAVALDPPVDPAGDLADMAAGQAALLAFCARRGDCFALLDTPGHTGPALDWRTAVLAHRASLDEAIDAAAVAEGLAPETLRIQGALYTPWGLVRGAGGEDVLAPMSGHVAGVVARVDARAGAHKAPANEVVEGLLDLEVHLDAAAQEVLNPEGATPLNCLRPFAGRGIRIWGARTLSKEVAWSRVSARRTVLSLRRFIDRTMPGMAFEPNDLRLWIRIHRELTGFLDRLFEQGALKGASAEEAYYVKCDSETNPPAVRDAGQVVTEIGLALATPREFIVVRLTHDATAAPSAAAP